MDNTANELVMAGIFNTAVTGFRIGQMWKSVLENLRR